MAEGDRSPDGEPRAEDRAPAPASRAAPSFPAPTGAAPPPKPPPTAPPPPTASAAPRSAAAKPPAAPPKPAPTAAKPPSDGTTGRSTWPWVVASLVAVAVALVLWTRSGDDPTRARGDTGGTTKQRASDAARRGDRDRDRDDVDPPAVAPRRPRAGDARRPAGDAEQTVTVVLDVEAVSEVFLDDRPVGHTPMDKLEVTPGTHQLRFKHDTLGERQLTLEARLGVQQIIKVDFEAKDEHDAG